MTREATAKAIAMQQAANEQLELAAFRFRAHQFWMVFNATNIVLQDHLQWKIDMSFFELKQQLKLDFDKLRRRYA